MKKIIVDTYVLPSYWASYLINDDASGLSDEDIKQCDKWLSKVKPGYCVGCDEDYSFGTFGGMGCDLVTYSFHRY
jgi:hypothetical protein